MLMAWLVHGAPVHCAEEEIMNEYLRWVAASVLLAILSCGCAQQQTSPNADSWQNEQGGRQSTTSGGGGK